MQVFPEWWYDKATNENNNNKQRGIGKRGIIYIIKSSHVKYKLSVYDISRELIGLSINI